MTDEHDVNDKPEYTIDTIRNWDSTDAKTMGFSAGGKANGRSVSLSMSIVQEPTEESTGIEGFNDWMADLADDEENLQSLQEAGRGYFQSVDQADGDRTVQFLTKEDKQTELEGWLGVRLELMGKNVAVPKISDTFKFLLAKTAEKPLPTAEQALQLSEMMPKKTRMTPEAIIERFRVRRNDDVKRSMEVMKKAMAHIKSTVPNPNYTPRDFSEVYAAAIESSAPAVVKTANSIEEAFANLGMLGQLEGRA